MSTENRCPSCGRTFTTPQGLGLHFHWKKCRRNPVAGRSSRAPVPGGGVARTETTIGGLVHERESIIALQARRIRALRRALTEIVGNHFFEPYSAQVLLSSTAGSDLLARLAKAEEAAEVWRKRFAKENENLDAVTADFVARVAALEKVCRALWWAHPNHVESRRILDEVLGPPAPETDALGKVGP